MKVYSTMKRKFIEVRNLKNIQHSKHPKYEFFMHKFPKELGLVISERSTGARAVWGMNKKTVIQNFKNVLNCISPERMDQAIKRAKLLQKKGR